MTPERREEIVVSLIAAFNQSSISEQFEFKTATEADLIEWHSSLGRDIRNNYGLWENDWEPELVDGVDYSPNHPDAISMSIINEVWRRVQ
jgi:hypothetical protein